MSDSHALELVNRLVLVDCLSYPFPMSLKARIPLMPVIGGIVFKQLYGRAMFRSYFRDDVFSKDAHIDMARAGHGQLRASSVKIAAENVASLFSVLSQYRALVAKKPAKLTFTALQVTPPSTLSYHVGQKVNTEGLVTRAVFNKGTYSQPVSAKVTGFDTATVGTRRATVSYTYRGVTLTGRCDYRVTKAASVTTAKPSAATATRSRTRVTLTATVKSQVAGVTPKGSVRFYLDANPNYGDSMGLLTLFPIDAPMLATIGARIAKERARKAVEKEFGDKVVTSFVEKVPESADAERVIRDMAGQGNKLIFGTTFGYMEPMLKVAADNKGVKFEHATGYKQGENMRTYDSRTYEGAYMAGVIAGKMTKSNTLGVVASIPIPEVIRNINSFTLGAQSSNPKVKTKVVWVNGWFDPPKETEAATSLINGGADVLFQNTDSPAVLKTAEAKGKRAFGWDSDMTAYGPKAHLASAVINWGPYYIKATKEALEGKWTGGGHTWWGVKEGAINIVSIAEDVPADTKAKVEEVKKGLADGSFAIWKGPITDNTGKVQVEKDAVADDKFLSGLNFYVKGVEGKIPGGK